MPPREQLFGHRMPWWLREEIMKDRFRNSGQTSRRDVLKAGAALGIGMATGLAAPARVMAQGSMIKMNVIAAGGSFSLLQNFLFKEFKFFEKYGVDANILTVSDGNKILAGLISGDGDICGGNGFSGVFPAIEKGAKIKLLAGAGLAPLNILYTNKPEIKSVKDIVGHTVGTGAVGALLHQLTVGLMLKNGIDYKKVHFVNVGSSQDVFKAVVGGTVDVGVAPIEFRDTASKYKLYPLKDGEFWKELPNYANQAMFAPDKAIADKRKGLVGVLAAYCDMFRWVAKPENKQAFMDAYKAAIPKAGPEEAAFYKDFLSMPGHMATNLVLNDAQLKYIQDLNLELGIQKALLPFNQCADMSLAEEALKLVKA
jgi:ABC-type nitrate/sulfonate/bicarbonate transport system substrate-binding protein